ncbi:hypothetical protein [Streptomyces sp. CC208A]|nr:hypothetical protein [Streptomyces sp. CC208A]
MGEVLVGAACRIARGVVLVFAFVTLRSDYEHLRRKVRKARQARCQGPR